jgi:hypothetical protein
MLTHKFIGVAHYFNVTLGTIRNTMTTNKPFGKIYHLENEIESGLKRELFPLLLVQCHPQAQNADELLFTATLRVPYTGSQASLEEVNNFIRGVIANDSCRSVLQEAEARQLSAARAARAYLRDASLADLKQRRVSDLRDLARDLFGSALDVVHSGSGSGGGSGLARSELLGLGEAQEGGSRMIVDKSDIVSALLETKEALLSADECDEESAGNATCCCAVDGDGSSAGEQSCAQI